MEIHWLCSHTHKVDMRKVNLVVLKPWIAKRVTELIGLEDDLVIEYVVGLLEDQAQPVSELSSNYLFVFRLNHCHYRILTPAECKST